MHFGNNDDPPTALICREQKIMKNAKQSIKKGKGGLESNKINKDYYDDAGSGYDYEEYGSDYGNYYDDNSDSASEGLGMFRSANKGNHLPSINVFLCHVCIQATCIFQNIF